MKYRRMKEILTFLFCAEGVLLMVYSFVKGVTFFSLLDLFLGDNLSLLDGYELYFLIGFIRSMLAIGVWEVGTKNIDLKKKSGFVFLAIEQVGGSFVGLSVYLSDFFTMRIKLLWTVEAAVILGLSIMFLVTVKKELV